MRIAETALLIRTAYRFCANTQEFVSIFQAAIKTAIFRQSEVEPSMS